MKKKKVIFKKSLSFLDFFLDLIPYLFRSLLCKLFCLINNPFIVQAPPADKGFWPFNPAPPFFKVHHMLDSVFRRHFRLFIRIAYDNNSVNINNLWQQQNSSYLIFVKSPDPAAPQPQRMRCKQHILYRSGNGLYCVKPSSPCAIVPFSLFRLANKNNIYWRGFHPFLIKAGFCDCLPLCIALDNYELPVLQIPCRRRVFAGLHYCNYVVPWNLLVLEFPDRAPCPYAFKNIHIMYFLIYH